MHQLADPCRSRDTLAALLAFGAPVGLIGQDLDDGGLLDYTAEKSGKLTISTELGGAGLISRDAVAIGERGVWNLLRHFGLVEAQSGHPRHSPATRLVETPDLSCFIVADESGIYESNIDCGGDVSEGEILGFLHHIDRCDRQPDPIVAPRDGLLICRRAQDLLFAAIVLVSWRATSMRRRIANSWAPDSRAPSNVGENFTVAYRRSD